MKKILVLPFVQGGVLKYRVTDPHIMLENLYSDEISITFDDDGTIAGNIQEFNYDAIFVHSASAQNENLNNLLLFHKSRGVKIITDVDDYWDLPHHHPSFRFYFEKKHKQQILKAIQLADMVICTTHPLRKKLLVYNSNVYVIPNSINPSEKQFKPKKVESEKVRIAWIGGSVHLEDLRLTRSLGGKLYNKNKGKIQMVLGGYDPKIRDLNTGEIIVSPEASVWSEYEKIITSNYDIVSPQFKNWLFKYEDIDYPDQENEAYLRMWTRPITEYGKIYNHADIIYVPLKDELFSNMKSQLKIIEAGFKKLPVVTSKVLPYTLDIEHEKNGFLVEQKKAHKDFAKYIQRLIDNPNVREDMGNSLHELCLKKFNLKKNTKKRLNIYKTLF
jgi:processive 1,2-diacylglycerol beta-glucosyltransferase